ncbi:MAG: hypothetical protein IKE94_06250, partial [Aeriscardovia sp.]|nr:hypothetical protein [Aeriscardovia sp.]
DGGSTKAHSAECAPVFATQNRTTSLQQTNETRADGASDPLICPHGVTYQGNQNGTPSLQLMNETRADGRGLYEIA